MAKAERAHSTSDPDSFVKSLFEPLPPEAEPVMSRDFKRETRETLRERWRLAYRQVESLQHLLRVHQFGEEANPGVAGQLIEAIGIEGHFWVKPVETVILRLLHSARHKLMMIPAPTKEHLRYKMARAREFGGEIKPEWEAAFAADEARLALPRDQRYGI